MRLRQWYWGIAVAAAALIPLSANADSLPNITAGANPGDGLKVTFSAVNSETTAIGTYTAPTLLNPLGTYNTGTAPDTSPGINGGSCDALGNCAETSFAAGLIDQVKDTTTNSILWTGATPGTTTGLTGNAAGTALGFVLYGIADQSVSLGNAGTILHPIPQELIDNQGATYNPNNPLGQSIPGNIGTNGLANPDGVIHIDLYYMSGSQAPCFAAGGSNCTYQVTAGQVGPVTSPDNSNVFLADGATTSTLFASFVLVPGVQPYNAPNGTPSVTLVETFRPLTTSGDGQLFTGCTQGVSNPGCSQFQPTNEFTLDQLSGYTGDSTYLFNTVVQLFETYTDTAASNAPGNNQQADGWFVQLNSPAAYGIAPVPEPGSLALLGSGLAFFGVAISRRRRKGISA